MSIRGKSLWLLLLILPLYAEVTARVDENPVIASEEVDYEIEAVGDRVEFPKIESIGGAKVISEGSRRVEWFEGNESVVKWVQVYSFTPQKSITIPSYKVIVNGKEEFTKPLFLQVKQDPRFGKKDFWIELDVSRKEAYVGESVDVVIRFREKRDISVMSVDFMPLKYENFWVKRITGRKRYREGDYLVHEVRYLFFPQKKGEFTIGPARVKVAVTKKIRDAFGFIVQQPQWIILASKSMRLHVKPLPDNVKLVGSFSIRTEASPKKVETGKPVTLTVRVDARGNIKDFEPPSLHIPGVTVYSEVPEVKYSYKDGIYDSIWKREYVLIADRPFIIPSFRVRFFDPEKREVKSVSSAPISIDMTDGIKQLQESEVLSKSSVQKSTSEYKDYILVVFGFAAGMVAMYIALLLRNRRWRNGRSYLNKGGELQMLQQLLPYVSDSKEAAQMAENIYANLFEGRAVKMDRRKYEKLMKKLRG